MHATRHHKIIWAGLMALMLLAPLPALANQPDPQVVAAEAVVPAMSVPVMINGQGPFQFVIDTGSTTTLISTELAAQLQLPDSGEVKVHAMGGVARIGTVTVDSIKVGANLKRKLKLASVPRANLGADGMLGLNMLRNQRMVMDFEAQTIRIEPSTPITAEVPRDTAEIVITARERRGQLVMVDADANEQKIWVVLDSGSQNSVGNKRLMDMMLNQRRGIDVKPISLVDIIGRHTAAEYIIVQRLRIGGIKMGNAAIAFADAYPFRLFGLTGRPSLLLGMETLRAFSRVTVDFPSRTVTFQIPRDRLGPPLPGKTASN